MIRDLKRNKHTDKEINRSIKMEHEIDKNGKRNRKKEGHEPIREKDLKVGRKTDRY
jgi:hypothetical protein